MDVTNEQNLSCPTTTWQQETEPQTQWNFDGCLANTGSATPLPIGFTGLLISIAGLI